MRILTSILLLLCASVLSTLANAQSCKGLEEPEIKEVIAAARELAELVEDDKKFLAIKEMSSADQKAVNAQAAMQPIDFTEEKHRIDRYALGDVVIESNANGSTQRWQGSAYKISRSCIVTAAHVLYPTTNQEMSEKNRAAYNGKITFMRGTGSEKEEIPATIFFQMTNPEAYSVFNGERQFKGRNDIVLLKLDNHRDSYYKPIKIFTVESLLSDIDPKVGKKISCMGSPSHMTEKTFGRCKGENYKWKQENARLFSEDISSMRHGIRTNVAGTAGMSGGACFFMGSPNQIFGLLINGYQASGSQHSTMPNINFESPDTTAKNIRHITTFDLLDKRMKAELGYGLQDLDKHCR